MRRNAIARRGTLPIEFTALVNAGGAAAVADWIRERVAFWRGRALTMP